MILFFRTEDLFYVVDSEVKPSKTDLKKLLWLFGNAEYIQQEKITGSFIGPRKEMITPWSTNAVEITQNMGIQGINRIERFTRVEKSDPQFDPMLNAVYDKLDRNIFFIDKQAEPVIFLENISEFNQKEGLALSDEEIDYLIRLCERLGRKLTDSEVYGFAQVNSEHCRHKIFNGTFIIDGEKMPETLFSMIKNTSKKNPNRLVSAYKDNVAFISGPVVEQFAQKSQDKADFFEVKNIKTVISLKAETHNFPTTVEPFNGAATGSGGEIRDRMAGGKGSIPMAGTAVYMTSYPRLDNSKRWEERSEERKWLYQTPLDILIKASNGASDFGNKFGQPLICGSLLTFEHIGESKKFGYDKVIMLAGGIGFGKRQDSLKDFPEKGDKVIVMGGDNYRIGMGGSAVSSVATGQYANTIELNAVQRSNPEMQKRVFNAIRAMIEAGENPIVSIHDHGAGGHLNCLSELVEETGAVIELDKLPIGDSTLSDKEIIGNESQERMGLILKEKNIGLMQRIAERERAPSYVVGEATEDKKFIFEDKNSDLNPINLNLSDLFGRPPKTILEDKIIIQKFSELKYRSEKVEEYLEAVLQIEAVACKDWLTNKVDRSVTGKIAMQQCAGEIQLPLNNAGVVSLDYRGKNGVATSIGHTPVSALIDPAKGSVLSVAEALTNLVFVPLEGGLGGVSLSANWMWPARNEGENARLYLAVKAVSDFAIKLGINIPTGKDSLSMTQKYPTGEKVYAPGTVIISAVGEVSDIGKLVTPVLINEKNTSIIYINFSGENYRLGGSSFAQTLNEIGNESPDITSAEYFSNCFAAIQELIEKNIILAGHDISAGGMITTLLEMTFANKNGGLNINLTSLNERDFIKLAFSENPGVIIQVRDKAKAVKILKNREIIFSDIGSPTDERKLTIKHFDEHYKFDINSLRELWFKTSYLFERNQTKPELALKRYRNYKNQPLEFCFNKNFTGRFSQFGIAPERRNSTGVRSAIIREKGVNGDREMAWSMYLAGFDVKDVHITDLIAGRENLEDVNFIVFVGGFSNSDVLGSAKGWAGAFLYNEKARQALDNFYKRKDTLSLGICNGCQLMIELGLINSDHKEKPKMLHNDSGKFESAFLNVDIPDNNSVMLKSLTGSRLGIWVAHGEGKFCLPYEENKYKIPVKYSYKNYPANPNGSDYSAAAICSDDGRHLAMMPHPERAILPWQWAYYPPGRPDDELTPWLEIFVNARKWVEKKMGEII